MSSFIVTLNVLIGIEVSVALDATDTISGAILSNVSEELAVAAAGFSRDPWRKPSTVFSATMEAVPASRKVRTVPSCAVSPPEVYMIV